ncbi:MAG: hypothetical protein KAI66_27060, partial [Lentisphaeria bacterium]|nr:hypothetical protein [Lentisphaeria bacterium]
MPDVPPQEPNELASAADVVVCRARRERGALYFAVGMLLSVGLLCLVGAVASGGELSWLALGLSFIGFGYFMYRWQTRREQRVYLLSDTEILERGVRNPKRVQWADIAHIQLPMETGRQGDNLGQLRLMSDEGKMLLGVSLGTLERGGKAFLFEVAKRLPEVVERRTRPFVNGEIEGKGGMGYGYKGLSIQEDALVVRKSGGMDSIPLKEIDRVDWLAKGLTGIGVTGVRIQHTAGQFLVPDSNRDALWFMLALARLPQLQGRVNPLWDHPLSEELDGIRRIKVGRAFRAVMLTLCTMMVAVPAVLIAVVPWCASALADRFGRDVEARVAAKKPPYELQLTYRVPTRGEPTETTVRVKRDFYSRTREGDVFAAKVLPSWEEEPLFSERANGPEPGRWIACWVAIAALVAFIVYARYELKG